MSELDADISVTLLSLVRPGMTAKELLSQVRSAYPNAKKRDITRAAFSAILAIAESDMERAILLQNFAIQNRGDD